MTQVKKKTNLEKVYNIFGSASMIYKIFIIVQKNDKKNKDKFKTLNYKNIKKVAIKYYIQLNLKFLSGLFLFINFFYL